MKKGISTIIATILFLIITISLTGTAYMFISGMIGARTSQVISTEISCVNGKIMLIVYNQGTNWINNTNVTGVSDDLKIYINNADKTEFFEENGVANDKTYGIEPHGNLIIISNYTTSGKQSMIVMTSSISQTGEAFC